MKNKCRLSIDAKDYLSSVHYDAMSIVYRKDKNLNQNMSPTVVDVSVFIKCPSTDDYLRKVFNIWCKTIFAGILGLLLVTLLSLGT